MWAVNGTSIALAKNGVSHEVLIRALIAIKLIRYFEAIAVAMFVYDYLLTLGLEIDLVWRSKWGTMKVLYLVQRYLPFFDSILLNLWQQHMADTSATKCFAIFEAGSWISLVGSVASELILSARLWAVWSSTPRSGIFLSILFALCWVPQYFLFYFFNKSAKFSEASVPVLGGCFIIASKTRFLGVSWFLNMAFDLAVLILMMIPALSIYWVQGSNSLYKTVIREGIFFYVVISLVSCINVIIITTHSGYGELFIRIQRVIHSMLTSRVLLHIRLHIQDMKSSSSVIQDQSSLIRMEPRTNPG